MFTDPDSDAADEVEIERDLDDREIRLRCLEIAAQTGASAADILGLAEEMYSFVDGVGAPVEPPHLVKG